MKCVVLKKYSVIMSFGILITVLLLILPTGSVVNSININPMTRITTNEQKVALSVNVYKDTDVDSVLNALNDTKATFFISEAFELQNGDKVKEIILHGHTIGILEEYIEGITSIEISDRLAERIEKLSYLTGKNCKLVRFMKNSYDKNCLKTVFSLGLITVQWSADDTSDFLESGDIVLLTGEGDMSEFIKKIIADGFETETVDGLIF